MEEENVAIEPVRIEENLTNGGEPQEIKASEEKPVSYGKFKSVDALLRAYSELEAEFTRRSQRLKALEENAASPQGSENGAERAAYGSDELYRAASENEGVRARILSDYLESLKGVPLMGKSGEGLTAPPARPKSFAEAGALALGYLRNNK